MGDEQQHAAPATTAADLDVCEQEPLAFSGMIQDVGALIATAPGSRLVSHSSSNLERWFDLPQDATVLHLNTLFVDDVDYFRYRQRSLFEGRHFLIANVITNRGIEGDLTYSHHPAHELYEFEPKDQGRAEVTDGDSSPELSVVDPVLRDELQIASVMEHVHQLTGYPKVMLYRFLEDGSGEVVAELSDDSLDRYQGLRFPSSDIPQIARNLYINNPYRLIFDTAGDSSPVRSTAEGDDNIDLSNSSLRSVSPVHVEYLGNMGVRSSASFPVLVMGRLWGLLALHAVEPTPISIDKRVAVRQLVESKLSRRIMDLRIKAEHRRFNDSVELISSGAELLQQILSERTLQETPQVLKSLVDNDGLIIRLDGDTLYEDAGLQPADVAAVADVGRRQALNNLHASDNLQQFMDQSPECRVLASGALYTTNGTDLPLGRLEVIWIRGEQARAVTWAGKPEKVQRVVDGEVRISPRKSFDAWSTETKGQSQPWASPDILVATKLMVQVMTGDRTRTDS